MASNLTISARWCVTAGRTTQHSDAPSQQSATARRQPPCRAGSSSQLSFQGHHFGGHQALLHHSRIPSQRRRRSHRGMEVKALDAAMPFDYEHKAIVTLDRSKRLTVGIVGFGTFGQFLARRLVEAGHQVLATSRGDYTKEATAIGVSYYTDMDDFCEEHPEIVLLATSILSLEAVIRSLPVQRLKRSTLFVDVLSVKEFPKRLMLANLPPEVDILCTHPMFGPDSGKASWDGLNLMFERVRVGSGERRRRRADLLLHFFESEGCRMVEMGCAEHDQLAASTQFMTHTVGRVLGEMRLQPTAIDTRGYQSLLDLVDNTTNDSFDLYYGLFMYNQSATEELERLEHAFDSVKKQLFDRLHGILREQLFHETAAPPPVTVATPALVKSTNGNGRDPPQMRSHALSLSDSDGEDD